MPRAAVCCQWRRLADSYTAVFGCVLVPPERDYTGPDLDHQNKQISFNATGYGTDPSGSPNAFSIVDVSDPSSLVRIAQAQYADTGYAHQGWLTEDRRYLLLDDELDEMNDGGNTRTYVWDVQDLELPVLDFTYNGPVGSSDHNLYTHAGYAYA